MAVAPINKSLSLSEIFANQGKRIAIFIVTYNAVTKIEKVLQRIAPEVYQAVDQIVIFDDASQDGTYEHILNLKKVAGWEKLTVCKNLKNLGYGGNQKAGYQYLIEQGFDIVVLLHGDGQYAPEFLPHLYQPLVAGEAGAVFGSRMLKDHGGPLKGGMPLYKYVGNKILTTIANVVLKQKLSEFHSGYRAYDLHALKQIDFRYMTSDFHFDTEIIVKLLHQGFRILERPIPTYYGDEICHVNGMKYAKNVVRSLYRYKKTIYSHQAYPEYQEYFLHYPIKESRHSSHDFFQRLLGCSSQQVLDLGCGEGYMAKKFQEAGHAVTGVDVLVEPKLRDCFIDYYSGSLDQGLQTLLPLLRAKSFDKILLMDILEHLSRPELLLRDIHFLMQPKTELLVSVPNVANITVRLALLFGQFNYTSRGILDRTHLKFWTRATIQKFLREQGYMIVQTHMTVMPVELALGISPQHPLAIILNRVLIFLTKLAPGLLGYQTIIIARAQK